MSFRLRYHLVLYVSILTFLLTAAIVSLYTNRLKEHALKGLTQYARTITVNTSFSLADHLFAENYAPLQEFVQEFSSRVNVEAIEISDMHGTILAASDIAKLATHMGPDHDNTCLPVEQDDICVYLATDMEQLVVTAPIAIEDVQLGRVRVYLTTKDMLAYVADVQRQGILTGFLCWLFAMLVGFFTLERLTKPMRNFVKVTESISRGEFDVELPKTKWVLELDKFSEALGVMAKAIAHREQELMKSEEKFRHLFERALEGFFVADSGGAILDVNPACVAMLGADREEELLGCNLFEDLFLDNDHVRAFQEKIASQGFVKGFELFMQKINGEAIIVSLSCHAVEGGEASTITYEGMVRDITAQKEAEQEVVRIGNYLNNIIESMPSMLIAVDENSIITQWNSAAYQLSGIASAQAIGRRIWDIVPFFQKYSDHFAEISRCRQPVKLPREQMSDGSERIYNMTLFPLVANGTSGIAIRLDDITELESKEQQLRQAQKMESIGTLAGGLAHDFNNVLGGILGNLSLMQFRLDAGEEINSDKLQEYLDRMTVAGNRAADMVRQLLTLSRQQKIDLVPVNLNLSIKHVRKICENTFDKSVEIVCHPAQQEARVLADPTQIEQVVLNLCINAGHAMTLMRDNEPWGGTLTMGLELIEVDDAFRKTHQEASADSYWRLSVSDTGVGMSTKTVSKIFDPFFTTKEQGKGTGLGLAMAYNIIKQLGGFIDVYSEVGLGSTFVVYLPLLTQDLKPVEVGHQEATAAGQGVVLVVDDDDLMRETATEILESVGYTVLTAKNGQEAVELYREQQESIDVVILDMVMPVLSGREAYLEMCKINSMVKVVLVSGFRRDSRIEEILQLGVKSFLQKPYTMQRLAKAVQEIITSS